jgi:hypothetical protein
MSPPHLTSPAEVVVDASDTSTGEILERLANVPVAHRTETVKFPAPNPYQHFKAYRSY